MNPALIIDALVNLSFGTGLTLVLTLVSLAVGFAISVPLSFVRAFGRPWQSVCVLAYTYVFRGTPMLVQLFLLYYGLSQIEAVRNSIFWPVLRDPFWCALIAFSLNSAAHTTEIFRRGLQAVPKGVLEAGGALGLGRFQRAYLLAFPIAFRTSLPAYGNEVVGMLKGSSLASTVTLLEVTGLSRQMVSDTFAPYEIFFAAAVIYLGLTFVAVRCMQLLENTLSYGSHITRKRKPPVMPRDPSSAATTP